MKSQILSQLKELCEADNLIEVQKQVKQLSREFNALVKQEQKDLEEKMLDPEYEVVYDAENEKLNREFNDLLDDYFEKRKEQEKENKESEKLNLALKQILLKDFRNLIENEENIGKAFEQVNEIRTRWKEAGDVPQDHYNEIQNEYVRLNDLFNYNIGIYKELKELDLKKNLSLKNEIIAKLEKALAEENGNDLQSNYRQLQKEWDEIGGTYKESWEEIKDKYWTLVNKIQEKLKDFFEAQRKTEEENLEKKQALINLLTEKTSEQPETAKAWEDLTKTVMDLQNEWKNIGNVPRSESKSIMKSFRAVCNAFFDNKAEFYKKEKDNYAANAELKSALVEKAEALKTSTDWQKAGSELINLQKEWNTIGQAGKFAERRLWKKFREANDFFFEAKKNFTNKQNAAIKGAVAVKAEIIGRLKSIKISNVPEEAAKSLQALRDEFFADNKLPQSDRIRLEKEFENVYHQKLKSIGVSKEKLEEIQFDARMENIADLPNAEKSILDEQGKIRKKIELLNGDLKQIEANMSFFKNSKSAEKLLAGPRKEMEEIQVAIDAQKDKLKQLNIMLNALRKQQAESKAE